MKIRKRILSTLLIIAMFSTTQVPEVSAATAALKVAKRSGGTATNWVSPKLANSTWSGTPGEEGRVSTRVTGSPCDVNHF